MFDPGSWNLGRDESRARADTATETKKREALKYAKNLVDSIKIEAYYAALRANARDVNTKNTDTTENEGGKDFNIGYNDKSYNTKTEYDSIQKALPLKERDGWFTQRIHYRFIELNQKYKDNKKQFLKDLLDKFIHSFPYLLFVSLPLFAFFLKALYIRKRKQFLYVDHGIFLLHLYIFTFIILLIFFAFYKLNEIADWGWIGFVQAALLIYGIFYTIKAIRNFYGQGWGKTILKFILLNILAFISLSFLFGLFFILSVFRI